MLDEINLSLTEARADGPHFKKKWGEGEEITLVPIPFPLTPCLPTSNMNYVITNEVGFYILIEDFFSQGKIGECTC